MGNDVSFDFDEFYLKFAYKYDKPAPPAFENSKYIKWRQYNLNSLNFLFAKILLTDMQENVNWKCQDLSNSWLNKKKKSRHYKNSSKMKFCTTKKRKISLSMSQDMALTSTGKKSPNSSMC